MTRRAELPATQRIKGLFIDPFPLHKLVSTPMRASLYNAYRAQLPESLRAARLLYVTHRRAPLCASLSVSMAASNAAPANFQFQLTSTCPASYELQDGGCVLRNRYRSYRSLRDAGVGGLKTGLPPLREGFTPQQIDLGRYLFFDPVLSADGSVSCASCHNPAMGFADGRGRAVGINGQTLQRSAPSLWNVGFFSTLLWDGSETSLEEQMQGPLYSAIEMGNTPAQLLTSLNANTTYQALFEQAFGHAPITLDQIYTAIAAFESSLISLNSRYDLYVHGYHAALDEEEIAGLNVFRSFVARCAECHTPPLFTNQQLAVLGVADAPGELIDRGAQAVTGDASQRGAFRCRACATSRAPPLTCTAGKNRYWRTRRASTTVAGAMKYPKASH